MSRRWIRAGIALAAVATWAMAAAAAMAADTSVTISGFAFGPASVTVAVGDTVTWTNADGVGHTATGSGFDTGSLANGASASVTFQAAGTFAYHCAIHPAMTGTVVVLDAVTAGTPGATLPTTDAADAGAGPSAPSSGSLVSLFALLAAAAVAVTTAGLRRRLRAQPNR